MVKYYGRARQRIGSVNTNQIGLKMSGCPSKVGRQGYLSRYIGRRAQCNQKYCGPVYYHGVIWKWNSGRCVAKAPRVQSFNSGVGHKTTPRFACGDTCSTDLNPNTALTILKKYFNNGTESVVLVGKDETIANDLAGHANLSNLTAIKKYYPGTAAYANLPQRIRSAVDVMNNLEVSGPITPGGKNVMHVVGVASFADQKALLEANFGAQLKFGPGNGVLVFALTTGETVGLVVGACAVAALACTAGPLTCAAVVSWVVA